ncbi:hypothetical protein WA158_001582 [Blastocystis sp. Blastoise]
MLGKVFLKRGLTYGKLCMKSFSSSATHINGIIKTVNSIPKLPLTSQVPTICQVAAGRTFANVTIYDIWPDHKEEKDDESMSLFCLEKLEHTYEQNKRRHYYDNGLCYEGNLVNGKMEGRGMLYRYNDEELKFNEDVAKIMEATKDIDPSLVEKIFKQEIFKQANNERKNNLVYEGQFKEGMKNGYGTEYLEDGTKYIGDFVNDKREGNGCYVYLDGSKLKCIMKNGEAEGKGTIINNDGTIRYEGEFKHGLPEGKGTYYLQSGGIYTGDMKNGKMEGHGSLTLQGISTYEGEFEDNKMHGQGKLYQGNRLIYEGTYQHGTICGQGRFNYNDGSIYEGEFVNGVRQGYGSYVFANGMYKGEFHNNLQDGHGILYHEDGSRYEGDFQAGVRHGKGIQYDADGNITEELLYDNGIIVKPKQH